MEIDVDIRRWADVLGELASSKITQTHATPRRAAIQPEEIPRLVHSSSRRRKLVTVCLDKRYALG